MRTIDIHVGAMVGGGKRTHFSSPKVRFTPEERLKDMDAQGVDVSSVVSPRGGRPASLARARTTLLAPGPRFSTRVGASRHS